MEKVSLEIKAELLEFARAFGISLGLSERRCCDCIHKMLPDDDRKSERCAKTVNVERDYTTGGSKVVSTPCHLKNTDGKCSDFEQ